MNIHLTDQPIDVAAVLASVQDDGAGAVNTFIGTVRNQSTGRRVVRLDYEAYDAMAVHQMRLLLRLADAEDRGRVIARQLYEGEEVGRVTWLLAPGVRDRFKLATQGDPIGALG